MVSSTPRPHFTLGKDTVPILQEAGWAPGPVWTGGKSRPHRDSIPDRPARSQSLYQLSYRAHKIKCIVYCSKSEVDIGRNWIRALRLKNRYLIPDRVRDFCLLQTAQRGLEPQLASYPINGPPILITNFTELYSSYNFYPHT